MAKKKTIKKLVRKAAEFVVPADEPEGEEETGNFGYEKDAEAEAGKPGPKFKVMTALVLEVPCPTLHKLLTAYAKRLALRHGFPKDMVDQLDRLEIDIDDDYWDAFDETFTVTMKLTADRGLEDEEEDDAVD